MEENRQQETMNQQAQEPNEDQILSEQRMIRRQKLADLKTAGKDPFAITTFERTAYTQQIHENFEQFDGQEVKLADVSWLGAIWEKQPFWIWQTPRGKFSFTLKLTF